MATIILNDGSDTLTFDGVQYRVLDWSDVYRVGPSRGQNLRISATDGTLPRGRSRDELPAELRDVMVIGSRTPSGGLAVDPADNCSELIRTLSMFLEAGPRQFTMTVEDGPLTLSAEVQFEEMGRWRFENDATAKVNLLFTVADGRFVETS